MIKKIIMLCISIIILSACNSNQKPDFTQRQSVHETVTKSLINTDGLTISERFIVPDGFRRVEAQVGSFANFLQNLELKPSGSKVKYFDGKEKPEDFHLAVIDYSVGNKDLQQCADAIMRLRAEYLFSKGRIDEIAFHFVCGFNAKFSKWADGYSISANDNNAWWIRNQNNNDSYESFQNYLEVVYTYASTLSLEKEMVNQPLKNLSIGDVFIKGASPGHCVIVVDIAINETTGEKIFIMAQGSTPAQDIHILKGDKKDSPWVSSDIKDELITPEWTFYVSDLKTWQ